MSAAAREPDAAHEAWGELFATHHEVLASIVAVVLAAVILASLFI